VLPPCFAVIVTFELEATMICVTAKVAEIFPDAILTLAGTVAALVLELLSVTVTPAAGAGSESVTVPATVLLEPPITLEAPTVTPVTVGA